MKKGLADIQQALKDKEKNQATYQDKSEVKCYNCGRRGHTKAECEAPTLCYNCKGKGHMSRDCPEKKTQAPAKEDKDPRVSSARTPATPKTELVDRLVARSPCSLIEIGTRVYGCIFDTGAEASIIPASLYNGEMRRDLGEPKEATGIFLNVIGVGGIEIPIEGFVEVPIKGKWGRTERQLPHCFRCCLQCQRLKVSNFIRMQHPAESQGCAPDTWSPWRPQGDKRRRD